MLSNKLLTIVVLLGTGTWAAGGGGEIVDSIMAEVRNVKAEWDLSTIARVIEIDSLNSGFRLEGMSDDAFSSYIRDNTNPFSGDSDPSVDPWEKPYRLRSVARDHCWVSSNGPDGSAGACSDGGGDDICVRVRLLQ